MMESFKPQDYSELLSFLNAQGEAYISKIPEDVLEYFRANCLKDYNREFDKNIPIQEQISSNALALVGYCDYTFCSSPARQKRIYMIMKYKESLKDQE